MVKVDTIEELPLTKLNVKILIFFAILKGHNWRRYALITPYVLLTVSDILDIYYNDEPIDAVMRKVYMTMLFFNAIIRAIYTCWRRFDYEDFLEYLRQLYNELQDCKEAKIHEFLAEAAKVGTQFTKINLAAGSFAYFGFIVYPLFTAGRGKCDCRDQSDLLYINFFLYFQTGPLAYLFHLWTNFLHPGIKLCT